MKSPQIIVAGHICLDLIPCLAGSPQALCEPGRRAIAGPLTLATGGAVANTGLALHRLGVPVRLLGKVGDDELGEVVRRLLQTVDPGLADSLVVGAGEPTSYTIVINPPDVDRSFLHCPGVNDSFRPEEIAALPLENARAFHFGYPPLMRQTYLDGGAGLADLFGRLRSRGVMTSLDMARPDPESESGRVDWAAWLEAVLPQVDVFLPSLEELAYMLPGEQAGETGEITGVRRLAERCLEFGAGMVAIKLGEGGLYLRTARHPARLPRDLGVAYAGRELLATCFKVKVAGTTGAGDCTIAGFLAGLVNGLCPEAALTTAVAAGACNVESPQAARGVPNWQTLQRRLQTKWERLPVRMALPGWRWLPQAQIWAGPDDAPAA
jgi:sugar/nucleoside kinase (ribokinase family)